ncbi:MAG: TetR/AcrR family transcriptional regulator [Actinobacteria bacterium]|nr:TetR/AcrR family transcriptional regulator [Actinomycetota bacterium]
MTAVSGEIKPAPRKRPQRRRLQNPNPAMRVRLMEAAAELLRRQGLGQLRIEELAREANVSVGTVYLYFDGKDDLFIQLVKEFTERLRQRMSDADGGEGPALERLSRRLAAYLDFVEDNMDGFLHFRKGGALDTNLGPLELWALDVHADDVRPLLEEAIAAGEIAPADPGLLSQALVGVIQHIAAHWGETGARQPREEIEHFLRVYTTFGLNPAGDRTGGAA